MEIEEFIWTPEDYNPSAFHINDLIILKLKTPFIFNGNVRPVQLPYDTDFASNDCIVSGWGSLFYCKYCTLSLSIMSPVIYSKKYLTTFQLDQVLNYCNLSRFLSFLIVCACLSQVIKVYFPMGNYVLEI